MNDVTIWSEDYDKLEALVSKLVMNNGRLCHSVLPTPTELTKVIKSNPLRVWKNKETGEWIKNKLGEKPPEGVEEVELTEEERNNLISKYKADNWYDWNANIRGSKWGAEVEHEIEIGSVCGDHYVSLHYHTAWSPNLGVSDSLVDMGFRVNHRYWESGCDFAGEFETEVEEVIDENGEEKEELIFQSVWESDYDFEAMKRLEHDLDERYVAIKKDWLEKNKHNQIGQLCMFGINDDRSDKPIGIYVAENEVLLFGGDRVECFIAGEDEDYVYFDRHSELGEELGWDDY